jgi:DMSO/TMAO reductase YedYZ molybdopterin-dependent catalytic subunit
MILPNVRFDARDQLVVGFATHRVATLAVDYFRHVSPFVVEGHRRVGPVSFVSRGFRGKRRDEGPSGRVPPGQYLVDDFPVLSAGPTPRTPLEEWDFVVTGAVAEPRRWSWEEFQALPSETVTKDIHCVTKWSKLDTVWEGVSVDTLLEDVESAAEYVVAFCDGGYTTNLPLEDVTDGKAWIAYGFDGEPLDPEHGGPARLLVPHLYFWKSAKWVRGLRLLDEDEPGFWESLGYHMYGDPWREQRYWGD